MLTAMPRAGEREGGVHRGAGTRPAIPYRPALDGIRALAVVAVFAYHAHLPWARAGFLGVDVFFVLSGYLITTLLLAERRREGHIDLWRFWGRRARRLLPAVVVLLAAVAVAVPLAAAEQAGRLRGDLLAALGYVSNWRLIFEDQSYFEAAGRPPVLQHLWSLAVEEQFYLLWPPVLAVALAKRPYRRLAKPLLLAAVASAVLMAVLFRPFADPSRVYFGTDTRAMALLVGAALAAATTRWQLVDEVRPAGRRLLDGVGLAGVAGLVWAVSQVNEFDPRLYRGGFLAVALLAAAAVAAAARPGPSVGVAAVLGARPLVWLGRRSYSVYLWFWPVLMLTRAHRDVPFGGAPLLALQAGLTLVLACASYRLVERPVREGALGRAWADLHRAWTSGIAPTRRTLGGLTLSVVLACLGIGAAFARDPGPAREIEVAAGVNAAHAARLGARPTSLSPATTDPPPAAATEPPETAPTAPPEPTTTTSAPPPPAPAATVPATLPVLRANVTAIGDSVLLGAQPLLEHHVEGIVVDTAVGRQFSSVVSAVRSYRDEGRLGEAVVVQTGNNGPFSASQFDQLMESLRGVPKVLVVNVKVDRAWQDPNNDVMRQGVARWPNAVLVDWHAVASAHPDAFFDDGLHLTATGIHLFTAAVLAPLSG